MEFLKDIVAPLVGATGGLMGIAAMLYAWLTGGSKTNSADIVAIREDQKKHDRRIQKVEDELNHLPTQNEVHEMKIALERLNGTIEVLAERLGAIGRIVTVIDESLRREEIETRGGK